MVFKRSLGSVLLPLTFLASGCGGATDRPAAADLKLKPGVYKVVAKQGSRAVWHDVVMVPVNQADGMIENVLPVFQRRFMPSNGAGSWKASDRPCEVRGFKRNGGTFTAKGECQIVDEGRRTTYDYSGRSLGDGFEVEVSRKGFGTRNPGEPDQFVIEGQWEREIKASSTASGSSSPSKADGARPADAGDGSFGPDNSGTFAD